MSIIRVARKSQYYMLPANIIEDRRLSWAARGMLVYLLSKPDNWRVQIKDLRNQTLEAIGGRSGRDKIYKLINELRAAGYVYQEFIREGGNFRGVSYEVHESPDLEQGALYLASLEAKAAPSSGTGAQPPVTDFPETVASNPGSPVTAAPFTDRPEAINSTESSFKIEKAPITAGGDGLPAGKRPNSKAASGAHTPEPGEPSNYPQNPGAATYPVWHAYARAYRAKYKSWPVCNSHMLGKMTQVVARVSDMAAMVATYYVNRETNAQIVAALHPVDMLLKHCEAYVTRVKQAEKVRKGRAQAESAAAPAAAPASAPPPVADAQAAAVASTPSPKADQPTIPLATLLAEVARRSAATPAAPAAPAEPSTAQAEQPEKTKRTPPAGLASLLAASPGRKGMQHVGSLLP